MKTKYIILKEGYDWLSVGSEENEITISQYRDICLYLKKNLNNKSILYDYNKLKFINYVGIIKVNNLVIEILPGQASFTAPYRPRCGPIPALFPAAAPLAQVPA